MAWCPGTRRSKSSASTALIERIHSASGVPSKPGDVPQAAGHERNPVVPASTMNSVANTARSAGKYITVASTAWFCPG